MDPNEELHALLTGLLMEIIDLKRVGLKLAQAQRRRNRTLSLIEKQLKQLNRNTTDDWWRNNEEPPWTC